MFPLHATLRYRVKSHATSFLKTERERTKKKRRRSKKRYIKMLQTSQLLKFFILLQSSNSGTRQPPSPFVRNFARSGNSSKFPLTLHNPRFFSSTPVHPLTLFFFLPPRAISSRLFLYHLLAIAKTSSKEPFGPLGRAALT